MSTSSQNQEVQEFFNRISGKYAEKYSVMNPFHHWYFMERLDAAVDRKNYDFNNKDILDIGTGTGALYDYLMEKKCTGLNFIGCDIAGKMLNASNIPESNRFEGHCYQISFPIDSFDYIFVLGVTTYLDQEEYEKTIRFVQEKLKSDGMALVSFTNKTSLNSLFYAIARPFIRFFKGRDKVAVQSFKTYSYNQRKIRAMMKDKFKIEKLIYINQTFFPFSHLFPNRSISFAKFIQKHVRKTRFFNFMSAEFIVLLKPIK